MTQDKNYKILDETKKLIVGHIYEEAYLTIKATKENILLGNLYGDPTCGLISEKNDWCVVGGSSLVIWTKDEIIEIKNDELYWVCKIRQKENYKVELLVNAWTDNSSIWEFDILTKEKYKIKDFLDYNDKEYTDNVEW